MKNIKNSYSILDQVKLAFWLLRTKLINRKIRLLRFPITIRGRKYIDFGEGLTTGIGCRFDCFSNNNTKTLIFGNNIQINDYVHIVSMESVIIEDDVLMASNVFISDNSHGCYKGSHLDSPPTQPPVDREYITSPVKIGKRVWLGEGVMVMPGVTIGEGSIIGAHSIVTKDIPANCIAVGTPTIIIKQYNFINKKWEKYNP